MPVKHMDVSISRCSMACVAHMKHSFSISGCRHDKYNISSAMLRRKSIHEVMLPSRRVHMMHPIMTSVSLH